ncbi:MAG: SCO family protein [Rhodomicrobium sp.]
MPRINPVLFVIALFVAGFAAAYSIRFAPEGSRTEGKALIGGPFSLSNTDGKRVTDRDFRGKLMLVFFGYTHCPDVCPTEMQNMADVMDKLGPDAKQVAPIFISVDPVRDTPQALSDYVKNFSPLIAGLTGTQDEVASAGKAYRVYFRKADGGSENYTVDHSVFVYLMDRDGNYLTHFMFNTPPETIVEVIKKQISRDKSS